MTDNFDFKEKQLNFGRYFRLTLMQSKMILLIVMIGTFIGVAVYLASEKTYKVSSLLQVYPTNNISGPKQSISFDLFNTSDTNLDNLIKLYTSRSNILNLTKNLALNTSVENLDGSEIFEIDIFSYNNKTQYIKEIFLFKSVADGQEFELFDSEKNFILKGKNGEVYKDDSFEILITFSSLSSNKYVEVTHYNPSRSFNLFKNKIIVSASQEQARFFSQEGLLNIYMISNDYEKAKKIIDEANRIFIQDNIKAETEKARQVITFIENQMSLIKVVLDGNKDKLSVFKQNNKSLNVDLEVKAILAKISEIEQKISNSNLRIAQAQSTFTQSNPLYINLVSERDSLINQKKEIEQKITDLPTAQQEFIDLSRDLETSEMLYSELVNRRLNYSLIEASTLGNIRVVDRAYLERKVGPNLDLIFIPFIFSLILGIVFSIFRGIFFLPITNPAELKDNDIGDDLVGVFPFLEDVSSTSNERFTQALETSILNIKTLISSRLVDGQSLSFCKKIVFTSPSAENGKSFVSRNLAENLSKVGNKVLLIDIDLKRGDQHKFFKRKPMTLNDFQNISENNIEALKVKENLYLVPRLTRIKSSFEYLNSNIFSDKLKTFETIFDYIIIDTAPILSVSDTGLLASVADLNLLIIRHELTKINEIKQSTNILEQLGKSFDGIIYNGYERPSGYYGYYDLYGDYSYRYYAERYLYSETYEEND